MRRRQPSDAVSRRNVATIRSGARSASSSRSSASSRVEGSAKWTSSSATTTGPCRARLSIHVRYARRISPASSSGARLRMRSSSSGSSFSESSRDRYGSTFGSSDSGRRPSFARSFVRTDSSGSPSSEPTQPRSIWTSGPYGQLGAVREAAALQPGHALRRELAELGEEARLADAGVAEQEEHLAAAVRELVDDRLQARDLLVAADERRQRRRLGRGLRADEAPGLDRLVAALHRQLAERLEHERVDEDSAPSPGRPRSCPARRTTAAAPRRSSCRRARPTAARRGRRGRPSSRPC